MWRSSGFAARDRAITLGEVGLAGSGVRRGGFPHTGAAVAIFDPAEVSGLAQLGEHPAYLPFRHVDGLAHVGHR